MIPRPKNGLIPRVSDGTTTRETARGKRIAILKHEADRARDPSTYLVSLLAEVWRDDGHEVIPLYGIDEYVPADLVIVHVDLSVVPDAYLEFARRYPVAVNGRVRDIRKSAFSENVLRVNEHYDGPVVLKTDHNCRGTPERSHATRAARRRRRLRERWLPERFRKTPRWRDGYPVYESLRDVPDRYRNHPETVVERFVPEIDDDLYCVRMLGFLGDRHSAVRLKGPHPIVNGDNAHVVEPVEPSPKILAAAKRLHFDYGKFDYVEVDGRAILLDINKTVGCSVNLLDDTAMEEQRRYRARGLYSLFP